MQDPDQLIIRALDELKRGGDREKASILAELAKAAAINALADELGDLPAAIRSIGDSLELSGR